MSAIWERLGGFNTVEWINLYLFDHLKWGSIQIHFSNWFNTVESINNCWILNQFNINHNYMTRTQTPRPVSPVTELFLLESVVLRKTATLHFGNLRCEFKVWYLNKLKWYLRKLIGFELGAPARASLAALALFGLLIHWEFHERLLTATRFVQNRYPLPRAPSTSWSKSCSGAIAILPTSTGCHSPLGSSMRRRPPLVRPVAKLSVTDSPSLKSFLSLKQKRF